MEKEIKVRRVSWEDYGISKNLQNELKAFCLQYDEKKEKIGVRITSSSLGRRGKGGVARPTEWQAIENVRLRQDLRWIEEAAEATSRELAPYILKSVTKDMTFEELEYDEELGRIPVGKTDFYGYRRLFFYNLQKNKIGDKSNIHSC